MRREIEATSWRLSECIRVRELASTHMCRLRILEEQKSWKRETGFDGIEIIAEIQAQLLPADFDSEPLYTGLYNPRWPHTPEEHKLDMDVKIEQLRLEILLSQPAPSPQDDFSPRRSPAVGTGLVEPRVRVLRRNKQCRRDCFLFSQCRWFLHVNCTSPDQETTISIQTNVGVDNEVTTTTARVAARQKFARLPIGRQQRETASTEQSKQFDSGG